MRRIAFRARAVVLSLLAGVLPVGCKSTSSSLAISGDSSDAGSPTRGDNAQSAEVLARVGDRVITLGDYVAALEHMDQFDRLRYQAPERRKELLREMIDVMLLADEARARGYDKDPLAEEERRQILRDAVLKSARNAAPAPKDISAADVAAYYEAHRADFHDPERRRVSAIVLPSATAGAAALEAAVKTAKENNPAGWGELVRSRSIDPQAKADVPLDLAGDLGFVNPPGDTHGTNVRVPEPVRAAAFEIKNVGDVLGRVVSASAGGGRTQFYVVRLAARIDGHDRSLQDAERSIRVKLSGDKADANEAQLLDDLRKQYPVLVDEAALAQVKVESPADAGPF